jgi:uncharacterized cupin superfamily protein
VGDAAYMSALRHTHLREDEFVYVVEGEPILVTNKGETPLRPGMCAGFKAGSGDAHYLINRSARDVLYLEIGDRNPGDTVIYPDDDIGRALTANGERAFVHRDGRPYSASRAIRPRPASGERVGVRGFFCPVRALGSMRKVCS